MSGNPSIIRTELVQGPPGPTGPASTVPGPTGPSGQGLTSYSVGAAFAPTRLASLTTTDATPTSFEASGSNTARLNQPANSSALYVGTLIARVRATGKSWIGYFSKSFTRAGVAPAADAPISIVPFATNPVELAGLDACLDIVPYGTSGDVAPRFTGLAATTIESCVSITQTGVYSPSAPTVTGPPPTLNSITPSTTPSVGGAITLHGSDFVLGAEVSIDGGTTWLSTTGSGTSLGCTLPAHAVGGVTLIVRNPDLQTDSLTYTYQDGFVWSWPAAVNYAWDATDATSVTAPSGLGTDVAPAKGTVHLTAVSGKEFAYGTGHQVNGHGAVGQGGGSEVNATLLATMTAYTIVARVKVRSAAGENACVAFNIYAPEDGVNAGHIHHFHGVFDNVGTDTITDGEICTLAWTRTADGIVTKYVDNVQVAQTTGVNTTATGTAMHVLWDGMVGHGQFDIAVLAVADSVLSGSDLTSLHTQMVTVTAP